MSFNAKAAKFANQFIEFEMPPKWQCTLEGAEWVCQNTEAQKKREAIIILAAKLRGDQDTLEAYMDYLKKPKRWSSIDGKAVQSEAKYAKSTEVNSQPWVDALHLESEIPGFYTRYLATVKSDIGVLVTYSVNKDRHTQYINDFENLVRTLKVFRKPGVGLNTLGSGDSLFKMAQVPPGVEVGAVFPGPGEIKGAGEKKSKKDDVETWFWIIVIGVAVVAIIILRKKRRGY